MCLLIRSKGIQLVLLRSTQAARCTVEGPSTGGQEGVQGRDRHLVPT